jgi:carbon monoxide dehydrogenase subunit G
MKKLFWLAGTALLVAGCGHLDDMVGQGKGPKIVGSGKSTKLTRSIGSFKSVELDGAFDAQITVGKQTDMTIEGDDNIAPLVKTEIKDGTLRIYVDESYSTKQTLKVTLGTATLEGASINGSGDISVAKVNSPNFSVAINGSGSVIADGTVTSLDANINGSGDLQLTKIVAKDAQVAIHGSGDAKVNVSGNLEASIAGSGSIEYWGNPKVTKSIAGSGDVKQG